MILSLGKYLPINSIEGELPHHSKEARPTQAMDSPPALPHIAIFPLMSKGHTIPLLHLTHLLHRRRLATVTFFTTPLNAPFIHQSLTGTNTSIIELPFPKNIPNIPADVESTDNLPTISLFYSFVAAVEKLQPHFEQAIETTPAASITFLISDAFLGWTNDSAAKFGIPRMICNGMGNFAITMSSLVYRDRPHAGLTSHKDPFTVSAFPNIDLTKADLNPPFDDPDSHSPHNDFIKQLAKPTFESFGMVVNTFHELEAPYVEFWNTNFGPQAWCVGPLCLAAQTEYVSAKRPAWMEWLDSRTNVLYVAFGTQADVSASQLEEIGSGLEKSGVDFLWVVRSKGAELGEGFEERVKGRGLVVREWVDQEEILRHESVRGFMSHCGWNSVMEAVSAGVPILAQPMLAEQPLNAKFVVDVLGIGVRVRAADGTRDGLVRREDIEEKVKDLMVGEKGKEVAERVKELATKAKMAMDDGGASICALEMMIKKVSKEREVRRNEKV